MIPTKITFRLPSNEAKALYKEALEQKISPHQLAKEKVIDHMTIQSIVELMERMAQTMVDLKHTQAIMEQELESNRWGMVETLAILVANQEGVAREHAREWIRNQFETHQRMDEES